LVRKKYIYIWGYEQVGIVVEGDFCYCCRFSGMQFTAGSSSYSICQQDVPCRCKVIATKPNTVYSVYILIPKCAFSRHAARAVFDYIHQKMDL